MTTAPEAGKMTPQEHDMVEGYRDGIDRNSPEPSANRSHSYRHGFANGRDDLHHTPRAPAAVLRQLADDAEKRDAEQMNDYERAESLVQDLRSRATAPLLSDAVERGPTATEIIHAMRTCRLCRGAQNLVAIDMGKLTYYPCPHCKGLGCTPDPLFPYGAPPKKDESK